MSNNDETRQPIHRSELFYDILGIVKELRLEKTNNDSVDHPSATFAIEQYILKNYNKKTYTTVSKRDGNFYCGNTEDFTFCINQCTTCQQIVKETQEKNKLIREKQNESRN